MKYFDPLIYEITLTGLVLMILVMPLPILGDTHTETTSIQIVTGQWNNLEPSFSPEPRFHHAMAFDSTNNKTILFGGNVDGTIEGITWEYDYNSNQWVDRNPKNSPPGLNYHNMVYDSTSKKIIMFGGISESIPTNQTWVYDYTTNDWTNMEPNFAPTIRRGHSMAYDPVHDKTILFGGKANPRGGGGIINANDLYVYDYPTNTWTELFPANPPAPRHTANMRVGSDNTILLYGGIENYHDNPFSGTWKYNYDANSWTNLSPPLSPSPTIGETGMVYVEQHGLFVIFGGGTPTKFYSDTWTFDPFTENWAKMNVKHSPSARKVETGIVYDAAVQKILIFSGGVPSSKLEPRDTWALEILSKNITTTEYLPQTTTSISSITPSSSPTNTSSAFSSIVFIQIVGLIIVKIVKKSKGE